MDAARRRLLTAGGVWALSLAACGKPARSVSVALLDMHPEPVSRGRQQALVGHIAANLRIDPAQVRLTATWAPRAKGLADDAALLLRAKPDVVVAISSAAVRAVRQLDSSIPVIFAVYDDPWQSGVLGEGMAARVSTGVWNNLSLNCKRLELLLQTFPATRHVAVLHDSNAVSVDSIRKELSACASPPARISLVHVDSRTMLADLRKVLPDSTDALSVPHSDICNKWPDELIGGIEHFGRPAFFDGEFLVNKGALASIEPVELNEPEVLGRLVASVLAGRAPSSLPIERPKTTRVCLNLQTAAKMKLPLPVWLIRGADRIIW